MSNRAREAIARVPLFSNLSPRYLKRLADLTEEQRYMAGGAVVKEGEIGDTFYVILEGEAKVVNRAGRVVNHLYPGDFFGEISLLDGGPRTASVVSETPMTMLIITRSNFLNVLIEDPQIAVTLMESLARMIRRVDRSLAR